MTLQVDFREGQFSHECLITDCEPTYLGALDPSKWTDITLHLFPKKCGVVNVSGLVISDLSRPRIEPYDFRKQPFAQFTVEY